MDKRLRETYQRLVERKKWKGVESGAGARGEGSLPEKIISTLFAATLAAFGIVKF